MSVMRRPPGQSAGLLLAAGNVLGYRMLLTARGYRWRLVPRAVNSIR